MSLALNNWALIATATMSCDFTVTVVQFPIAEMKHIPYAKAQLYTISPVHYNEKQSTVHWIDASGLSWKLPTGRIILLSRLIETILAVFDLQDASNQVSNQLASVQDGSHLAFPIRICLAILIYKSP